MPQRDLDVTMGAGEPLSRQLPCCLGLRALTSRAGQAQAIHAFIRGWLGEQISPEVAEATRVIYGGSVSAGNSAQLAQEKDIDGFLVGGASLKPDFLEIIKASRSK